MYPLPAAFRRRRPRSRRAFALALSAAGGLWAFAALTHGAPLPATLFRAVPFDPGTAFAVLVGPTGLTFPCWAAAAVR